VIELKTENKDNKKQKFTARGNFGFFIRVRRGPTCQNKLPWVIAYSWGENGGREEISVLREVLWPISITGGRGGSKWELGK